ncbi:MAG: hydrogenase maturation nickel metallochaperone HypA [Pontibacterium sp.]
MHEMSIAERVLQIIEEQAQAQHYVRVKTIWLEIGPLAMIEPASLIFCFDAISKDSIAGGAKLIVINTEGEACCLHCQKPVPVKQRYDCCPLCGSHQLQITRGDELRIKELEVEA